MKWFFCFNSESSGWFADMIKVAVASAHQNAPDLDPHCIIDGSPDHEIVKWLKSRNVAIHFDTVPFMNRLSAPDILARNSNNGYNPVSARGYYLPLTLPFHAAVADDEFVLFTDCDVQFMKSIDPSYFKPSILCASAELADVRNPTPNKELHNGFNSGVMLLNLEGMRTKSTLIREKLEEGAYYKFRQGTYDQGVLNEAISPGEWDILPDEYNWRVAFGINPNAAIIHWHGPKPRHVEGGAPTPAMQALLNAASASYRHYASCFAETLNSID